MTAILLAIAWLSPLHVPPWVSWQNELAAGLAVLFAGSAALAPWRKAAPRDGILLPSAVFPLALLAAIALLQSASGVIAYWGSFWVIGFYAVGAAAAAAGGYATVRDEGVAAGQAESNGTRSKGALTVLAQLLLAVGFAQLLVVFSQTFHIWQASEWIARTAYQMRGAGNVAQPNHAALLFLMGIAGALYLYECARFRAVFAIACVAALSAGLATTESRSGAIGFCALAAWWAVHRGERSRRQSIAWSAGAVLAFLGMYAGWPKVMGAFWFLDHPGEVNLTTSGRLEIWRQLADAVLIHPWVGWGVLQVAQAQGAVAASFDKVMAATYSHNLVLDIALWAGIPAAAVFLVLALRWSARRLRIVRSPAAWFCVALLLPMAVQAMSEFPYAYAYFLFPAFFAMGALDAALCIQPAIRLGLRPAIAVWALVIAGVGWSIVEYVRIEDDFRVARFEAMRVGKTPVAYEQPKVVLLTQLGALLEGTRIQPAPAMSKADLDTLYNVAMLYPWAPARLRYLIALALNGQADEARRQLKIIRVMHGSIAYAAAQERLAELSETYPVLKELAAP